MNHTLSSSDLQTRSAEAERGRDALLSRIEMPLRDMEFAVEAYLLANGAQLDTGTRAFLAHLRDGVGVVATSARQLSCSDMAEAPCALAPTSAAQAEACERDKR